MHRSTLVILELILSLVCLVGGVAAECGREVSP